LLADNVLHPRFSPTELAQARDSVAGSAATVLNGSRFSVHHLRDERLYPPGDPALRYATPQSVEHLSLDDVRAYYANVFRPEMTTIVVVGAVTPERATAAIEKAFGGWTATGRAPDATLPPVPLNASGSADVHPAGERQDLVTLAQLVPVTAANPHVYALDIADTIFGGGMGGPSTSRLFRDLRQNSGLVYAVEATLSVGETRSMYEVNYASEPRNANRARELVVRDARTLGRELVPADELALAKATTVRRIILAEADETAIARDLLSDALTKRPLDEGRIAAQAYLNTTAADVRDAFAKFVRPDGFVQITEGP
jgi:zinc protease